MADRQRPGAYDFILGTAVGKVFQNVNTWLYERTGGKVGGRMGGAAVCLLTTKGRKTGRPRTVPLLYLEDGDRVIVVASKAGWDHHPLWYLNLKADPHVTLQIGARRREMTATEASDDERAAYWARLASMYPDYDAYQSWTDRRIPVVVLSPT